MCASMYVDRWDYRVSAFEAKGVAVHCFLVEGDQHRIGSYLQRTFGDPSGGQVTLEPVGSSVLVLLTSTDHLRGVGGTFPDIGHELALAFMIVARDVNDGGSLVLVAPYLFVDNPLALIQGREVFGFPKDLGFFDLQLGGGAQLDTLAVDVLGVPTVSGNEVFARQRLIEIARTGKQLDGLSSLVDRFQSIVGGVQGGLRLLTDYLRDAARNPEVGLAITDIIVRRRATVLNLKQFHEVADSGPACYQAIIACNLELSREGEADVLRDDYTIVVNDLASHPIGRDLGLAGTLHVDLSFTIDLDFVQTATVRWS
jgi:hypothetical protein